MNKHIYPKIKEIKKFQDEYILGLAITDHINELKLKDDYMKMIDEPKKDSVKRKNYQKELTDLHILLTLYFEDKQEIVSERMIKILNHQKNNGE